ncbi:phosphatidylinositide phosphatase sac1-like protein [Plasmopara halstedii]|uniref:Phosphatidylinositide phosphatase sac1-like protein n=1 Tax=Plasmopara halstedii TaxID=4781 RepID=A0A0N7L794_PLAHL|nr:phosphatidylinositide phosphatase sac1-like protein [Plasmopara halstedii]CEG46443.1 phosphatidylinositide phosphatase sac1-like protein [Plasmopara halstedii]|eukprot:XP_024582812.1 phosphatidylinositide phosphatase sac1-like protein [Plasmopara halstedii]
MTDWVAVNKGMLSRLLYPNPVCLLSVCSLDHRIRSLMTISWLTAINNQGKFICSVHTTRNTAILLKKMGAVFVLNVPVRGMEELILAIGGTSSADGDKFEQLNVALCAPGGGPLEGPATSATKIGHSLKQKVSKKDLMRQEVTEAVAQSIALSDCVAHLVCRVDTVTDDDGHLLLRCTQLAGWARQEYWDGRNFIAQYGTHAEPYLTFLGSKTFGYVLPEKSVTSLKEI